MHRTKVRFTGARAITSMRVVVRELRHCSTESEPERPTKPSKEVVHHAVVDHWTDYTRHSAGGRSGYNPGAASALRPHGAANPGAEGSTDHRAGRAQSDAAAKVRSQGAIRRSERLDNSARRHGVWSG